MPYGSPSDAPSYVPQSKRAQWVEVWNSAYKKAKSDGKDNKAAEQSAFKQANGVTMTTPSHSRLFATSLSTLGELVDPETHTYKIPVAYTGTFYKDGDRFSITEGDLHQIVKNMTKKPTSEANLDYEHASEMPEIAKGGPIPSAGAVSNLSVELNDGEPWLYGLVRYTDLANQLVESKQYRYFSPAIDWSATDKTTGLPQGATLTSAALTNRPFLEKLPPLLMSEVPRIVTVKETITMADKKLRMKKSMDGMGGTHIHVHQPGSGTGADSFGECMGEIEPKDFECMTAGGSSSSNGEPDLQASLGETVPMKMTDTAAMSRVKLFYEAGKKAIQATEAQQGHKLLAAAVTPTGEFDKRKSLQLLSEGKVSPQQYAAHELAVQLVEQGVSEGKIHPTHRAYYLTDAISRPTEFEEMLKTAKPFVSLGEHGLSGVDPHGRSTQASDLDMVAQRVKEYRKEHNCNYATALKAVTKNDAALRQRMNEQSRNARTM